MLIIEIMTTKSTDSRALVQEVETYLNTVKDIKYNVSPSYIGIQVAVEGLADWFAASPVCRGVDDIVINHFRSAVTFSIEWK